MYREIPYNFGCLPPLPEGYQVLWYSCHEHYQAIGPDDWESPISVDPYWCRRCAIVRAASQPPIGVAKVGRAGRAGQRGR